MVGSVGGWVLELFFRRIFSSKKWINPGFLNGPYLPMYGCGTLLLYGACFIPLPRWALVLILVVALTLLEYITGLIFIKGLKIKLWDYSRQWGNIQGIICPLFSLLWGCIAAGFVYLLFDPLHTAAVWAGSNVWMIFAVGAFAGVFIADLCVSFNVSLKIRKAAAQFKDASVDIERLSNVKDVDTVRAFFDERYDPDRPCAVFHTFANGTLRREIRRELDRRGIPSIDLLGPAVTVISTLTGEEPSHEIGAVYDKPLV